MLVFFIEQAGQAVRTLRVERTPCRIGRSRDCELHLPSWRVGRLHAEVRVDRGLARIVDHGTLAGTTVNGVRIADFGPISPADRIEIAGFRLRVHLDDTPRQASRIEPAPDPAVGELAHDSAPGAGGGGAAVAWRRLLHRKLLDAIDLRRRDLRDVDTTALRAEIRPLVDQLIAESPEIPATIDRDRIACDVVDEAVGLGPLEPLLADDSVSEIMVNAADEIWVERNGTLARHPSAFSDEGAVRGIVERIVAPLGRRIDESSPMVDARLGDGSRVNAVIPPLAVRGVALTIRRFNRRILDTQDLQRTGTASPGMIEFLGVCVERRRNLVISGGTGSGKTTLLNVLSNRIPRGERVITIEDAAELSLGHPHLVRLESRPANLEQRGEVTIRDLVRNALRMRPDRIVIGECRGGEALDMLQSMNTGHDGSMTTVHANSPRDVVSRLEVMALMAGMEIPVGAIREQIASAIDVIVHQTRFADGSRRITSIVEVTGIESGRVQMHELFRFRSRLPAAGGFVGCGALPSFYEALRAEGVALDLSIFDPEES